MPWAAQRPCGRSRVSGLGLGPPARQGTRHWQYFDRRILARGASRSSERPIRFSRFTVSGKELPSHGTSWSGHERSMQHEQSYAAVAHSRDDGGEEDRCANQRRCYSWFGVAKACTESFVATRRRLRLRRNRDYIPATGSLSAWPLMRHASLSPPFANDEAAITFAQARLCRTEAAVERTASIARLVVLSI